MNMKFEFKTKDYVLLGIMVAIYFMLYMLIGMAIMVFLPGLSYFISMPIIGLFGGVIITFVLYKIPKMWVFTLFNIAILLIFTLMGMIYLPLVVGVLSGAIIADLIANTSAYKNKLKNAIANGMTMFGMVGSMISVIWISTEYYTETVMSVGASVEMANLAIKASSGWIGLFTLAIAFLGSFAGIYLGYAVLSKHFNRG